jgi:hypothetical protein
MIITRLKNPWGSFKLCWLIRMGMIRATPAVREVAKSVTFAMAYGAPGRLGS